MSKCLIVFLALFAVALAAGGDTTTAKVPTSHTTSHTTTHAHVADVKHNPSHKRNVAKETVVPAAHSVKQTTPTKSTNPAHQSHQGPVVTKHT